MTIFDMTALEVNYVASITALNSVLRPHVLNGYFWTTCAIKSVFIPLSLRDHQGQLSGTCTHRVRQRNCKLVKKGLHHKQDVIKYHTQI